MELFLTFTARRDLREKAFRLFTLRGDGGAHDNTPLITEIIAALRAQKAKLLGHAADLRPLDRRRPDGQDARRGDASC